MERQPVFGIIGRPNGRHLSERGGDVHSRPHGGRLLVEERPEHFFNVEEGDSDAGDDDEEDTETSADRLKREDTRENGDTENLTRRHNLGRFRADPVGFIMRLTAETSAFWQGTGWRSYSNYIGARILYNGYTAEIEQAVLNSRRVTQTIKTLVDRQAEQLLPRIAPGDIPDGIAEPKSMSTLLQSRRDALLQKKRAALEQELRGLAKTYTNNLLARMDSPRRVRFAAFVINNLLARMYHQGIYIKESEFLELRKHAIRATAQGIPLIILPSHKSHVDYMVISYIFFRCGLALPHVVAGDNLDMPVVGRLLKGAGAFFIRRSFGDDPLYQAIVKEYVNALLERGHTLECFIEGTRSRTGKVLTPKFGILKFVLDAVLSGRIKDAVVVPVSIGYDRVIETGSYVNELLGANKEKESLRSVVSSTRSLQFKWGRIDVRFAKPYSLNSYVFEQIKRRSTPGKPFTPSEGKDMVLLLQALGYQILADINAVSVIMPTALVGTIILTLRGRGVARSELVRRVKWLRSAVLDKGGRVADFGGMRTGTIVDRAVGVLRELVGEREDLLERVFFATKRFELSFYRNQAMHLFIKEAITSVSMYATIRRGGSKETQRVPYAELLDEVTFLSRLLKVDFIYPPGTIEDNLKQTLQFMVRSEIICADGEHVWLSDRERARGRENFDFYCFLIWPFVDAYWLAVVSMFSLAPSPDPQAQLPSSELHQADCGTFPEQVSVDGASLALGPPSAPTPKLAEPPWIDEKLFMSRVQLLGRTLYYQGDLTYYEAINKETLKNAYLYLQSGGEKGAVLRIRRLASSTGQASVVSLDSRYVPFIVADHQCSAEKAPKQPSAEYQQPQNRNHVHWNVLPQGALFELMERVGRFRREGRTLSSEGIERNKLLVTARVLRLALMVGRWTPEDIREKFRAKTKGKPTSKL